MVAEADIKRIQSVAENSSLAGEVIGNALKKILSWLCSKTVLVIGSIFVCALFLFLGITKKGA